MFLPLYLLNDLLFPEQLIGVVLAIGAAPGYVKILYGFLSDSRQIGNYGYRRGYVLISIPLIVGGWLILPFAVDAVLFTTVLFITTLGVYLGDTAVDAWAVDVTPPSERGSMMGLGWGAQGVASVFGVLVTTIVGPAYGFPIAFIILGLVAGIGSLLWFIIAREKPIVELRNYGESLGKLRSELNYSYIWLAFVAYLSGGFIFGVGTGFLSLFYQDVVGASEMQSGIFVLVWSVFFFIGGGIGGTAYDKFKDYRTGVYVMAPFYALGLFLLSFNQPNDFTLAYATTMVFGIGSGLTTAAIMGFAMHITPKGVEGTTFAIFTSLVNVGQAGIASVFLGYMVGPFGYAIPFVIGALCAFPIILLARFIVPPWKKQ
jgi:DHA2 family methylenomycin A resistance protein-like MFS transporter